MVVLKDYSHDNEFQIAFLNTSWAWVILNDVFENISISMSLSHLFLMTSHVKFTLQVAEGLEALSTIDQFR